MSMLSLLMVITTHGLFRSLRTIPGWNNILLSVCLLFAQILLQYSASVDRNSKFHNCLVIGILLHFTWLATFFAMNVCSFHMYYVFSSKALTTSHSNTKRTLFKYIAWVVVMPKIIIAAVIGINMAASNSLGYGNTVCFLDTIYDVAFGFITPACLIFVSNFAFFLITFCKIHRSPTLQSNMEGRRDLVIYLKLCTITGLAWPLLLVDAIFDLSWFSFIAVTVNGLQGFFIFLAFVCNERVLNLYTGSLRRDSSSQTTTKGNQIVSRSNTIRSRSLKLKKYND
ncbi:G-protein coupled receptor Mth2-like [Mya arenaria]|uniref:G-protein coupled receptor Mth2-like n=1 Tax=Mya arenaria TaxID=6604 RepID=UPI0022DEDA89|nr:G-protein coupled receptor Mth2-like [Mya arenaria]